ncbi:hypothetical protein SBC1_44540 (plasmid) [Caballeronia sp. SBC1]|nr:hypothetical protein SBC2_43430 [Caballeronia sp. SBC2]QIN64414.1 hypothetical protein SBC1_44540 [Caballeronia sp. SBC1]
MPSWYCDFISSKSRCAHLITLNTVRRWAELGAINVRTFYRLLIVRIVPCFLLVIALVNLLAVCGVGIFQNHAGSKAPISFWLVNAAALTFWLNVLMNWHG